LGDLFASSRWQGIGSRFANLRFISEFFDLKRLATFTEVPSRVNHNLSYFSSNYAVGFVMLSIDSLLTRTLIVTGGLCGILKGRDLNAGFFRQLYTALLIVAVSPGLLASLFSTRVTGVTGFWLCCTYGKPNLRRW
jgi:PRA1 family protein 1